MNTADIQKNWRERWLAQFNALTVGSTITVADAHNAAMNMVIADLLSEILAEQVTQTALLRERLPAPPAPPVSVPATPENDE